MHSEPRIRGSVNLTTIRDRAFGEEHSEPIDRAMIVIEQLMSRLC